MSDTAVQDRPAVLAEIVHRLRVAVRRARLGCVAFRPDDSRPTEYADTSERDARIGADLRLDHRGGI